MTLQTLNTRMGGYMRVYDQDIENLPWKPGDMCSSIYDQLSLALVLAVFNDGEETLVMWVKEPSLTHITVSWSVKF